MIQWSYRAEKTEYLFFITDEEIRRKRCITVLYDKKCLAKMALMVVDLCTQHIFSEFISLFLKTEVCQESHAVK